MYFTFTEFGNQYFFCCCEPCTCVKHILYVHTHIYIKATNKDENIYKANERTYIFDEEKKKKTGKGIKVAMEYARVLLL